MQRVRALRSDPPAPDCRGRRCRRLLRPAACNLNSRRRRRCRQGHPDWDRSPSSATAATRADRAGAVRVGRNDARAGIARGPVAAAGRAAPAGHGWTAGHILRPPGWLSFSFAGFSLSVLPLRRFAFEAVSPTGDHRVRRGLVRPADAVSVTFRRSGCRPLSGLIVVIAGVPVAEIERTARPALTLPLYSRQLPIAVAVHIQGPVDRHAITTLSLSRLARRIRDLARRAAIAGPAVEGIADRTGALIRLSATAMETSRRRPPADSGLATTSGPMPSRSANSSKRDTSPILPPVTRVDFRDRRGNMQIGAVADALLALAAARRISDSKRGRHWCPSRRSSWRRSSCPSASRLS